LKVVGLIGCGAIGKIIAQSIQNGTVPCDKLILFDADPHRATELKSSLTFPTTILSSVEEMIALKPSIIIEAASQQAVREYLHKIVEAGIEIIIMSTGALLDKTIPAKVHITSGAIGGLDAISSAHLAGLHEVLLSTHKPPKALDMSNVEPQIVYEGFAEDAARLFPREMNVAATLAITAKPARVKVQVISDPKVYRNTHEITVKWKYGEMSLKFSNDPHPENPKTSALAAWSAIRLLKTLLEKT
jgi:aspartate dehydrogenase